MWPSTNVRRRKAVELTVQKAARQSGDDLGAGANHSRPPTANANTRLYECQYTASYVRIGGQTFHAPCSAKQLSERRSDGVSSQSIGKT